MVKHWISNPDFATWQLLDRQEIYLHKKHIESASYTFSINMKKKVIFLLLALMECLTMKTDKVSCGLIINKNVFGQWMTVWTSSFFLCFHSFHVASKQLLGHVLVRTGSNRHSQNRFIYRAVKQMWFEIRTLGGQNYSVEMSSSGNLNWFSGTLTAVTDLTKHHCQGVPNTWVLL